MNKGIIYCNCTANNSFREKAEIISAYLNNQNIPFIQISDLCEICTHNKAYFKNIVDRTDKLLIIACYRRAVNLLLEKTGIDVDPDKFSFINLLQESFEDISGQIIKFSNQDGEFASQPKEIPGSTEWQAWFPLIDYSRCTSCSQCADFCLFGVYEKKDNKVMVVNPENCKTNCPACARICPQTAIIFPKYEYGGAIGGADNIDEVEEQQRQQKDIDAILGSEIYKTLEGRKMKRQSIIRNNAIREALREREKALSENKR